MGSELPPCVLALIGPCFDSTELVIAAYDQDDVLRYANASYERRFLRGLPLPLSFSDVLRHGHAKRFGVHIGSGDVEAFLKNILPRRRLVPYRAFEVDTIDGEWLWMTETVCDGWMLSIGSVITSLKDHERVLQIDRDHARRIADIDGLTGVCNRRRILELAEASLAACQRAALPCSLALIDLDYFKVVNDTLGHLAGDELLVQFAAHCTTELRHQDRFGRYGGEEFLLVLPESRADDVVRIIERMRARLQPAQLSEQTTPYPYTFSAGVAQAGPGEPLEALLRRVDEALYRAKRHGRNRTEH